MAHILVVEDEPQLRALLRLYLEREGHCVTDVGDGASALAAFETDAADLVVLDLMLPGHAGRGGAARLSVHDADVPSSSRPPSAPTRSGSPGLRSGADDYLAKPFNPHELTARVAAILRRSAAACRRARSCPWPGRRLVLDLRPRRWSPLPAERAAA